MGVSICDHARELDAVFHTGANFDTVKKEFVYGGCVDALLYTVNGMYSGELLERLLSYFINDRTGANRLTEKGIRELSFLIPMADCTIENDLNKAVTAAYSGCALIAFDGFSDFILLDTRKYPTRSIEEPMKDKVLRGSRDGFSEALPSNFALIRRRIRDPRLICLNLSVGYSTETDVLLCYMEGIADGRYVEKLRSEISQIRTMGLNLGLETLTELLIKKTLLNPFPKVRYTERPDAASAMLLEGKIIVLCDNYPAAMILPTSLFDFLQDTDDFYFSPLIGGYMKFVRNAVYALSLLLTPVWYVLQQYKELLPESFSFIMFDQGKSFMPLFLQLMLVEIAIDGLKLASLNTPDTLSNSLSVISGLILGDLAVSVGWLSEQVILYMAFVAIANFTQPSYELGYAFKFMRIVTLCLISLWSIYGFAAGILLTVVLLTANRSLCSGKGYLYPLIPFDKKALKKLFLRGNAARERLF